MLNLCNFKAECERIAREEVNGCRNQKEHAVKVARRIVPTRYTKQLKSATAVLRVVGVELGTKKWSDRRDVLDSVLIDKITDKMVIGKSGERVTLNSIIAWGC